jgi:hypothetical protein
MFLEKTWLSFEVPGFQSSRVPGFLGSRVPGFQSSRVPGFLGFLGSKVSRFQGSSVPVFRTTLELGTLKITAVVDLLENIFMHTRKEYFFYIWNELNCSFCFVALRKMLTERPSIAWKVE